MCAHVSQRIHRAPEAWSRQFQIFGSQPQAPDGPAATIPRVFVRAVPYITLRAHATNANIVFRRLSEKTYH